MVHGIALGTCSPPFPASPPTHTCSISCFHHRCRRPCCLHIIVGRSTPSREVGGRRECRTGLSQVAQAQANAYTLR